MNKKHSTKLRATVVVAIVAIFWLFTEGVSYKSPTQVDQLRNETLGFRSMTDYEIADNLSIQLQIPVSILIYKLGIQPENDPSALTTIKHVLYMLGSKLSGGAMWARTGEERNPSRLFETAAEQRHIAAWNAEQRQFEYMLDARENAAQQAQQRAIAAEQQRAAGAARIERDNETITQAVIGAALQDSMRPVVPRTLHCLPDGAGGMNCN